MPRKIATEVRRPKQVQMRKLDSLVSSKCELRVDAESLVIVTITVVVGAAVAMAVVGAAAAVVANSTVVDVVAAVPMSVYDGFVHWLQNPYSMLMPVPRSGP